MTENDGREAGLELALNLMASSVAQTQRTTDTLLDNLRKENLEHRVELEVIRQTVADLLGGPYMPNPNTILMAVMYPNVAVIKEALASLEPLGFGVYDETVSHAVGAALGGREIEFIES